MICSSVNRYLIAATWVADMIDLFRDELEWLGRGVSARFV